MRPTISPAGGYTPPASSGTRQSTHEKTSTYSSTRTNKRTAPETPAKDTPMSNPAFLTSLTPDLEQSIRSAAYIALDLETTALTAYSPTAAPAAGKKIGDGRTIKSVLGRSITIDEARPRIRVVSIGLPEGRGVAFDLDKMNDADKARLLSATAAAPVWIGQNLGFDLSWYHAAGYPAKPFLLDAMLVVRTCKPSYTHAIATAAAGAVRVLAIQSACYERIDGGKIGYSLADLALAMSVRKGEPVPVDKSWQKPENWMLPDLIVPAELDYCLGDITLPGEIIIDALGVSTTEEAIDLLQKNSVYCAYSAATVVLAEKHASGMYVNPDKMVALAEKELSRIHAAIPVVTAIPEFVGMEPQLLDTGSTEKAGFKSAMAGYCRRALGVELVIGDAGDPAVGEPDLILSGVAKDPVVDAILDIREAKKRLGMLSEWKNFAQKDGCIHSLVNSVTDTGRTSSSNPNDQQIPHDPAYREVFTARPGYKIIASDYSAVEMRIAARLALRAMDEWNASKTEAGAPDFFCAKNGEAWPWLGKTRPAIVEKAGEFMRLDVKPEFQKRTDKDYDGAIFHDLCWALSRIKRSGVRSRLAEGFASGIDAHLLTAVGLTGSAPDGVDPLKWLQGMSQTERDYLKKSMKQERQAAKACNFGLLYGMSTHGLHRYGIVGYGLDWSIEEADAQRAGWFELYPEILFWQCWSKLTYRKWPNSEWISKSYGTMGTASKRPLFVSKTLFGRPIFTTDSRKLLNYQDQGTGADIAMTALANLGELSPFLRTFVHDEFVLEVPEAEAEKYAATLEKVMLDAARSVLDPVGIEVETAIGDWWIH